MGLGTLKTRTGMRCVASVLLTAGLVVSPLAQNCLAASYTTAYDMDFFLNQPHPFDVAPTTPSTESPTPSGETKPYDELDSLESPEGLDDLDDLNSVPTTDEDVNDPLEPVNRFIFGFNQIVETVLYRPIATTYNTFVPEAGRGALSNFISNLSSPVVFANDMLQGEFVRAFETGQRALINTTIGVGGLWDAAEWMGIPEHDEDFGQTLAVWGVGEGVYLVLPFLGPSNPRDMIGIYGVDNLIDPVSIYLDNEGEDDWILARFGATAVVRYSKLVGELEQLEETSLDYYAAIRSLYRQSRAARIDNLDGNGAANDYVVSLTPAGEEFPD